MAYALLAGMPPIYGLYASLIPLVIYALLGSSTKVAIGPVAVSALLVVAGISKIAEPGSASYISYVISAGLFIGVVQLFLGLFKFGFLSNFLSRPVIAGFTSAAAVIIIISQLNDALGIPSTAHSIMQKLFDLCGLINEVHWPTLLITASTIILIIIFKKISKKIPGPLIIVVAAIGLSYYLDLENFGINILREVPSGLPAFEIPVISLSYLSILWPTILAVTAIGIVESIGIAKAMESKYRDHKIDANQEILALGLAKIGGAFFQAIPTSASFSRSAINSENGAKTTVAGLFTVVLVVISVLFLTSYIYYLPKAVLAAIILLAVVNLFEWHEAQYLWTTNKKDLVMMLITFISTLVFGIELGVLIGVMLSILLVLYKTSRPHVVELGQIKGTQHYKNLDRFGEASPIDETLIIRFDSQLYYGNASFFKDVINQKILDQDNPVKYVVLDGSQISDIDSTGMHVISELDEDLKSRGIELHLCGAIGPVRDALFLSGLLKEKDKHHISVDIAVNQIKNQELADIKRRLGLSTQTNENL